MKNKIVFWSEEGGLNHSQEKAKKQQEIADNLKKLDGEVIRLEWKAGKAFAVILQMMQQAFSSQPVTYVFSGSLSNLYEVAKLVHGLPFHPHIVYWPVDNTWIQELQSNLYASKYLKLVDLYMVRDLKMKKSVVDLGFNNVWEEPNISNPSALDLNLLRAITIPLSHSLKAGFRRWFKHNQWVYYTRYKQVDRDYKKQLALMKQSSVKSESQKKEEMAQCARYWKCPPLHYVRYGLFDKQLPIEDILDYIPVTHFYNDYMERQLEGLNHAIYDNKLMMYYLFEKYGIPTPQVMAIVKNGILQHLDGSRVDLASFASQLNPAKKYFFKPVDGAGGTGIKVLKHAEFNNLAVFIDDLSKYSVYVVQEGIEQRDDLQQINSSSVNTLRVITQYNGDTPKICACVMRIGRNGKDVDNSHQGGMSCAINVADGTLNEVATAEHGGGDYVQHPDSCFVFKGKKLADWDNIKTAVLSYASKFPELKEIGWDIAITTSGVQAIEMNLGYGIDHLQVSCGGMRRTLNIYKD